MVEQWDVPEECLPLDDADRFAPDALTTAFVGLKIMTQTYTEAAYKNYIPEQRDPSPLS